MSWNLGDKSVWEPEPKEDPEKSWNGNADTDHYKPWEPEEMNNSEKADHPEEPRYSEDSWKPEQPVIHEKTWQPEVLVNGGKIWQPEEPVNQENARKSGNDEKTWQPPDETVHSRSLIASEGDINPWAAEETNSYSGWSNGYVEENVQPWLPEQPVDHHNMWDTYPEDPQPVYSSWDVDPYTDLYWLEVNSQDSWTYDNREPTDGKSYQDEDLGYNGDEGTVILVPVVKPSAWGILSNDSLTKSCKRRAFSQVQRFIRSVFQWIHIQKNTCGLFLEELKTGTVGFFQKAPIRSVARLKYEEVFGCQTSNN